ENAWEAVDVFVGINVRRRQARAFEAFDLSAELRPHLIELQPAEKITPDQHREASWKQTIAFNERRYGCRIRHGRAPQQRKVNPHWQPRIGDSETDRIVEAGQVHEHR